MTEPNNAFSGFLCSCPFSPHSYLVYSFHTADRMVLLWNAKPCSAILLKLRQSPPLPSNGRQTPLNGLFVFCNLVSLTNLASPLAKLILLHSRFSLLFLQYTRQCLGTFAFVFLPETVFLLGIHRPHPLLRCHVIRDTFPSTNRRNKFRDSPGGPVARTPSS